VHLSLGFYSHSPPCPRGGYECDAFPDLQLEHVPGVQRRCFLALVMGTPRSPAPAPPRGTPSTSSALVVAAAGLAASTSWGPTIDVFSFSGGRCRTCRQHTPDGLPSSSLTSVVAAAGYAARTPLRSPHQRFQLWWWPLPDIPPGPPPWGPRRRLQLQWWPLPDMPPAPPTGSAIDVFSFGGGRCRTCHQHTQGARHQRLQLRWWPLLNMALAPLGGRHRRLQLWWWPLSDLLPAPPRRATINVFNFVGGCCRTYRSHLREPLSSTFLSVDGGRSRITSSFTSRGPTVDVS
jgi:hypothetical protein